jgi:hypothetical protein
MAGTTPEVKYDLSSAMTEMALGVTGAEEKDDKSYIRDIVARVMRDRHRAVVSPNEPLYTQIAPYVQTLEPSITELDAAYASKPPSDELILLAKSIKEESDLQRLNKPVCLHLLSPLVWCLRKYAPYFALPVPEKNGGGGVAATPPVIGSALSERFIPMNFDLKLPAADELPVECKHERTVTEVDINFIHCTGCGKRTLKEGEAKWFHGVKGCRYGAAHEKERIDKLVSQVIDDMQRAAYSPVEQVRKLVAMHGACVTQIVPSIVEQDASFVRHPPSAEIVLFTKSVVEKDDLNGIHGKGFDDYVLAWCLRKYSPYFLGIPLLEPETVPVVVVEKKVTE